MLSGRRLWTPLGHDAPFWAHSPVYLPILLLGPPPPQGSPRDEHSCSSRVSRDTRAPICHVGGKHSTGAGNAGRFSELVWPTRTPASPVGEPLSPPGAWSLGLSHVRRPRGPAGPGVPTVGFPRLCVMTEEVKPFPTFVDDPDPSFTKATSPNLFFCWLILWICMGFLMFQNTALCG